jgi:folate-binding protein YgfZ
MTEAHHRAATGSAVFLDRPDRTLLLVQGRSPAPMLNGILSGTLPPDLREVEPGVLQGRMPCSLILTPKGKVVTTLRVGRLQNGEAGALLLDFPGSGLEDARAHLARYLPPRMARLEDPPEPLGMLTLIGPDAPALLSGEGLALGKDAEALAGLEEGGEFVREDGSTAGMRVVRSAEAHPFAADVIAAEPVIHALAERLEELGVPRVGGDLRETLRIERGRPAFGTEIDEGILPPEAGIQDRCIDHRKGCYTGQEVIVRIRDRGKVNRNLRGLLLGDIPLPAAATPLFEAGGERAVGEVRSAAASPAFREGIALGYVRGEVAPPATLRLGTPAGPEVRVRALSEHGWVLVEGDPTPYP